MIPHYIDFAESLSRTELGLHPNHPQIGSGRRRASGIDAVALGAIPFAELDACETRQM
ncbi:MAG: hypothetical protein J0I07_39890 [Myxococcales bacterium]|nr:hypothetical protein [Myxococcales bacterium]